MIRPENERLTITLSKKQIKWLNETAKKMKMTTSKFIKFLIDKNIASLTRKLYSDEELKKVIEILKTPWINFDDDDDDY